MAYQVTEKQLHSMGLIEDPENRGRLIQISQIEKSTDGMDEAAQVAKVTELLGKAGLAERQVTMFLWEAGKLLEKIRPNHKGDWMKFVEGRGWAYNQVNRALKIATRYEHVNDVPKTLMDALGYPDQPADGDDDGHAEEPHRPKEQRRGDRPPPPAPIDIDHSQFRLDWCRFQDWDIPDGLADLFFTDVPYDLEWLIKNGPEFVRFVERKLKEGGVLAFWCGVLQAADLHRLLREVLTYGGEAVTIFNGLGSPIWLGKTRFLSMHSPLLLYSKGKWTRNGAIASVQYSLGRQKGSGHPWEKPLRDTMYWVEHLSDPGQTVVDCCAGSFTTARACKALGRQFLGCDEKQEWVDLGRKELDKFVTNGCQCDEEVTDDDLEEAGEYLLHFDTPAQAWKALRVFTGEVLPLADDDAA